MRWPPQLLATTPIIPACAARTAWKPAHPKWVAPRTDTSPIPCRPARATASSMASAAAHRPRARRASMTAQAPRSVSVSGSARGSQRPDSSNGR